MYRSEVEHLSRCSPDAIRDIAAYVEERDDWIARLEHDYATLQSQCASLKEALEEIAASDSDNLLNPHSNEGRVLTVCMDIARAALQDEAKSND